MIKMSIHPIIKTETIWKKKVYSGLNSRITTWIRLCICIVPEGDQRQLELPKEKGKFIVKINSASVLTLYPEDLEKIKKLYTKDVVKDILDKNKEVIAWIKNQF